MSNFSNFINLLPQSKTLRFELKPTENTAKLLEKNNIVNLDEEIDYLYKNVMRLLINDFHARFIENSLANLAFDAKKLSEYKDRLISIREINKEKNPAKKKILESQLLIISKELRVSVSKSFEEYGNKLRDEYISKGLKVKGLNNLKGIEILTKKELLDILLFKKKDYETLVSKIKKFKNFWTYFSNFNENRKNYYSSDDKSTSIANRIVNENLPKYINNLIKLEGFKHYLPELGEHIDKLSLDKFSNYLNQSGIDKYNKIIGGNVDDNKKIKGINEIINEFCQKNKEVKPVKLQELFKQIGVKNRLTHDTLVKLEELLKQIEVEKRLTPDTLVNLQEFLKQTEIDTDNGGVFLTIEKGKEWNILRDLYNKLENPTKAIQDTYTKFFDDILNDKDVYDLNSIYFNSQAINTISSKWFVSWQTFGGILKDYIKIKKNSDGELEMVKDQDIRLSDIKASLEHTDLSIDEIFKKKDDTSYSLNDSNNWKFFIYIWHREFENILTTYFKFLEEVRSKNYQYNNKSEDDVVFVKEACDVVLNLLRFIKYNSPKNSYNDVDNILFPVIEGILKEDSTIINNYNAFRNYITQKPYSQNKIKLNFSKGSLLGGWSQDNKGVRQYSSVIMNKNGRKFLGILTDNALFSNVRNDNPIFKNTSSNFQLLNLNQLKFTNLTGKAFINMAGKLFSELNEKEKVEQLKKFIKKTYLDKYPVFKNVLEKNLDYKEFKKEIDDALVNTFKLEFSDLNEEEVLKAEQSGKIYIFEILNKDLHLSMKNNGSKTNIHTMYWEALFSKENLSKPRLKLLANAEVFYRKGQKDKLDRRRDNSGKEVLANKRYADDKYFFHVPIGINIAADKYFKFKDHVNKYIAQNDVNIIGIDRGEKHLIYYSVINQKGEILKQGSLNIIQNNGKDIDYNKLLEEKASNMMEARKNWKQIGTIKELKSGYLSQVVHEIYRLMIEYNAVVVLEDLNSGFKAKRTAKVEKSVYKKFEIALAKKLSHLIIKDRGLDEKGGVLNAYQLCPPIDQGKVNIFENSKQWGMIFKVRPNYTSTTDPVSGWRHHRYLSSSAKEDDVKSFFDYIKDKNAVRVEYSDEYNAYTFSYNDENTGKTWTLVAFKGLERFTYNSKEKKNYRYDIFEETNKLFEKYDKTRNINEQIMNDKDFKWSSLRTIWRLINQIRNTDNDKEGNENDFLQSPVYSPRYGFYDSRKVGMNNSYKLLPDNGDANGAYNTARKGIILINRIKENYEKPDMYIKDVDWDIFLSKI